MKTLKIGYFIESHSPGGLERFVSDTMEIGKGFSTQLTVFYSGREDLLRRVQEVVPQAHCVPVSVFSTKIIEDWIWLRRPPRLLWKSLLPFMDVARWICLFLNLPLLRKTFRAYPVDVLHVVNGGYPASMSCLAAILAARKCGIPRIVLSVLGMPRRRFWLGLESAVDRCVSEAVDAVASCSQKGAESLCVRRNFPSVKSGVLYHGVRPIAGSGPLFSEDMRKKWKLGPGPIIGNISVLEPYKGHRYLIEAVGLLKPGFPNIRCFLVGGGKEYDVIKRYADDRNLGENIVMVGHVEPDPLVWLSLFDVFVHPTMEDALPYVVLDAMALGKPIVATQVGGVPEQVVDGESGLLVSPGDSPALAEAIKKLLRNPALATSLGQKGCARVREKFSMASMEQGLFRLYGVSGVWK